MVNLPSGHAARGAKLGLEGTEGDVGPVGPPRAPRAADVEPEGWMDPPPPPPRRDTTRWCCCPSPETRPASAREDARARDASDSTFDAHVDESPNASTPIAPHARDRARGANTQRPARQMGIQRLAKAPSGRRDRPTGPIDSNRSNRRRIVGCQNQTKTEPALSGRSFPRSGWCDSWPNERADSAIGEPPVSRFAANGGDALPTSYGRTVSDFVFWQRLGARQKIPPGEKLRKATGWKSHPTTQP